MCFRRLMESSNRKKALVEKIDGFENCEIEFRRAESSLQSGEILAALGDLQKEKERTFNADLREMLERHELAPAYAGLKVDFVSIAGVFACSSRSSFGIEASDGRQYLVTDTCLGRSPKGIGATISAAFKFDIASLLESKASDVPFDAILLVGDDGRVLEQQLSGVGEIYQCV